MYRRTVAGLACLSGLALFVAAAPAPPVPQPTAAKLTKRVKFDGFNDVKTTLREALDLLAKQFDLTFDVNDRAFAAENQPDVPKAEIIQAAPLPPLKNVRLDAVLRKVLARVPCESGATYMLRDDLIEVTTRQAQAAEVWGEFNGPRLPLVNATLDKVPLEDALKDLAEQAEFNVLLDNRAGERGKTPVSARLRNLPLDTALRLLSDMADLRSVHIDNALYVTTKENAAAVEARLDKEKAGNPQDDENANRIRKGSGPNRAAPTPAGKGAA
jgi:hypothetical protein